VVEALPERIEQKIEYEPTSGCWMWVAACSDVGYGNIKIRRRTVLVHRVVYELLRGPIPLGLTLDHRCRVRSCLNPNHLEPVTFRENILRGEGPTAQHARKTRCPQGHPYDAENRQRFGRRRSCSICTNMHHRNSYWRRRA